MLMVTTTEGMLNRLEKEKAHIRFITTESDSEIHKLQKNKFAYIHSHTTDTRPAVPLGLVLVVCTSCLQDGFVNTTTTSNNTFNI